MPGSGLIRSNCPNCGKGIGIRADQLSRRLRCPACRYAFSVEPDPPPDRPQPPHEIPSPQSPESAAEENWLPADDANELTRASPPKPTASRAKLTAGFQRPRPLVFQAAVQAVRGCRLGILDIDWTNHHLRFALTLPDGTSGEHDLFVFDTPAGMTEIDLTSRDPDNSAEFDMYYQAVVREVGKYLMFAGDAPAPAPPPPPPLSLPPPEDDVDYRPRRRRRRGGSGDGLAIAGFVCALVGVVLFCIPLLGGGLGTLGIVFGGIGMSRKRASGFAVASLVLGIVACLLAFVAFLVFLENAERRRY